MSNGTGVELKISTDKAKQQINELISNLKKLHEMFDRTLELKLEADATAIKTAEQDVTNLETTIGNVGKTELKLKVDSKELEKVANGLKETEEESKKAKRELTSFEKILSRLDTTGKSVFKLGNLWQSTFSSLSNFSSTITRWAANTGSAVYGIFDKAVGGVSNLASEGFSQLQTLENSMAGYKAFFSEQEGGFDQTAFKKKIVETANKLPGLDTGGLADAIMQLAPLSSNSDQAYNASLGVIKALKYSGSDSSELGYVIRNLRDVVSKGAMNERDRQQFLRAIPALEKILVATGQTQFLNENGKLKTLPADEEGSAELVAQLMQAFANINDNPEVNKVFEEMQNTTQGVLEKFRQTMKSSFLEAFETPGTNGKSLVDTLKQFLNDNNIQKFADVIGKVGQKVADFVSTINFDELLDKLFSDVQELADHVKTTLLPTIKKLLGMDENSSTTDMIKRMMDVVKKFLKGMIDGFNTFLGIVDNFKNTLKSAFPNIDFATILGNIAGFSKFGFSGIGATGKLLSGGGKLLSKLGNIAGGLTTKSGGTLIEGGANGIFASKIANGINLLGAKRGISGTAMAGRLLKGAGTGAAGLAITKGLSELSKQITNGNEDIAEGISGVGNFVSSLASGFVAGGPLGAAIAGSFDLLGKFKDAFEDYATKALAKGEQQDYTIRDTIDEQATKLLEQAGVYTDDPTNQRAVDARNAMLDYIDQQYNAGNIKSEEDLANAVNASMNEYMKRYVETGLSNGLSEVLESWRNDPNKQEFNPIITTEEESGLRVITDEAMSEGYGDKIAQIYDKLVENGVLDPGDQKDKIQDPNQKYRYLVSQGIDMDSKEEVDDVFGYVTQKSNELGELWGKLKNVELNLDIDNENTEAFKAKVREIAGDLGWQLDTDGKYYAEVRYKIKIQKESTDPLNLEEQQKNFENKTPGVGLPEGPLDQAVKEQTIKGAIMHMKEEDPSLNDKSDEELRSKAIEWLKAMKGLQYGLKWDLRWGNYASGGLIKLGRVKHFAGGGKPWGVDTVPTMLQPGEFVIRKSAAEKIGYPTLTAMNQGDLMAAYRNIGADISSRLNQINTSNNTDDHSYHRQVSTRQVINNYNYNRSGATNSIYRSFRNIAALTR